MAGESSDYPAGNGVLVGRRARRHRAGRDSVALQHSRLRSTAHSCPQSLRDCHSRIPASLRAASKDSAIRRHTSENRLLLPCELRHVSNDE